MADNWDSTAAIEGWGLGVTAIGASSGWAALGVGASGAISLGTDLLIGNPFGGSQSKTKAVATGQHAAGVKGGGVGGPNALGANRPGIAETMGKYPEVFKGDLRPGQLRSPRKSGKKWLQRPLLVEKSPDAHS